MRNWPRFIGQCQKTFNLWLFFAAYFAVFRFILIFFFRHQINDSSGSIQLLAAFLNGIRYDFVVATYIALIPFVLSIVCGFLDLGAFTNKVRNVVGTVFIISSTVIYFVSLGYFKEYGHHFDHFLFGLIYDDSRAVLITLLKEYNLIPGLIGMLVVILVCLRMERLFLKIEFLSGEAIDKYLSRVPYRIIYIVVFLSLFTVGIRGSFGSRPVQLKDAAVTRDEFLNETVLNPYTALVYAIGQQLKLSAAGGLEVFLPDGDLIKAAKYLFSTDETFNNLDRYMIKYAKGPKGEPPRHIFLIVGESYSAWPLLKKYEPLGLAESVRGLARKGLYVESFVPSSRGTMSSLSVIVTGLPDAGLVTNYQKTSTKAYPSSLAAIFKQLGYKTRLFYGGFLSWQRIGVFSRAQGFEEIYGGGHMGNWASSNEWGVDDEYLFDFILRTVKDDRPSFNLIMTTSFHPPYDIDVRGKGFKLTEIPRELRSCCNSNLDFNMLGHFWYSDRCIGDFVKGIEKKLKLSLIVVTGDHAARKTISERPSVFERLAVPLVFYGGDVLKGISLPQGVAGSHLDIGPTLVELTAPKGFRYHSLGKDLLDPEQRSVGIGRGVVIGPDFIVDLHGLPKLYPLPDRDLPRDPPDLLDLKKLYGAIHGFAWWRIKHGASLKMPQNQKR